jgi:hypothetical protein
LHNLFDELSDAVKKIRKNMNCGYATSLAGIGIMLSGNLIEGSMIVCPVLSGFFLVLIGILYNDDLLAPGIEERKE